MLNNLSIVVDLDDSRKNVVALTLDLLTSVEDLATLSLDIFNALEIGLLNSNTIYQISPHTHTTHFL